MPLTALGQDGKLDTTTMDVVAWARIYKSKPRWELHCQGCGGSMYARVSRLGLRHFVHHVESPDCPHLGESVEHMALKALVARWARAAGHSVVLEEVPKPGDAGGWRADVMATAADRGRTALEIQLSPMTAPIGRERTERYRGDGVDVVWLTTKHAPWLYAVPSVRISESAGTWSAGRGRAQFEHEQWHPAPEEKLEHVVVAYLSGELVATEAPYFSEAIPHGNGERFFDTGPGAVLVASRHDAAIAGRFYVERDRRRAAAERDRVAHQANLEALIVRQALALPIAIADAQVAAAERGYGVFVGVPAESVSSTKAKTDLTRAAAGNAKTAQGRPVWIGPNRNQLDLFAVVCPVASLVTPGLAYSWDRRGAMVYATEIEEAHRLAPRCGGPERIRLVADRVHT